MIPTVVIRETAAVGIALDATDVRDLTHVRRLLLQALVPIESEGAFEHVVPEAKLHLLRGWLTAAGVTNPRRLLLMALLQLEDEDEGKRLVMPGAILPALSVGG